MDLSSPAAAQELAQLLQEKQPIICFLINNAGVGKMGSYADFSLAEVQKTISLNCGSVAALCTIGIPYMEPQSHILNIASQAAFQPDPYINLYAAGKAFVRSYTRALNVELAGTGITATAVCPGWVKTELLAFEKNGIEIKFPGLVDPDRVVRLAIKDAKKRKDMSVCTLYVKFMHLLAKLFPQKLVMKTWCRQIRNYI